MLVGGTPCRFGVGGQYGPFSVWESCKMLSGTPCGLWLGGSISVGEL